MVLKKFISWIIDIDYIAVKMYFLMSLSPSIHFVLQIFIGNDIKCIFILRNLDARFYLSIFSFLNLILDQF